MSKSKLLNLMKKYCVKLNEADDPEELAVYQALLPMIIRCEIKWGDAIECETEDLVRSIINFMAEELLIPGLTHSDAQRGGIVEDTIEFVIKSILERRLQMIENVNCRNFVCVNNKKGGCSLNRIVLEPQGALVRQVRCIEAEERSKGEPTQEKGGQE